MTAEASIAEPQAQAGAQPQRQAGLLTFIVALAIVVAGGSALTLATQGGTGDPNGKLLASQGTDLIWAFLAAIFGVLALLGFALRAAGYVRRKNALKAMMQHFIAIFLGLFGFFFVGFGFQSGGLGTTSQAAAYGGLAALGNELTIHSGGVAWGLLGWRGFTLSGGAYDGGVAMLFLFQVGLLSMALMIPLGAMLERFKLAAAALYLLFGATLLYTIFANWTWGGGWLAQLGQVGLGAGYVDTAGSGVIHAVGGWVALAGVYVLRPRIRKFNMDETPNVIPAHNLISVLTGSMLVFIGWLGVVAGAVLGTGGTAVGRIGTAAVVIIMAGAGGALASLLTSWVLARPPTTTLPLKGYPDATMLMNGGIAGLVAGSAGCACVSPLSGVLIGGVAGILLPLSMWFLEERGLIDDPVSAISIHGVCGAWGQLAVGIFADGTFIVGGHAVRGLVAGDATQLAAQAIGVVAAFIWGFGGGSIFFNVVNRFTRLRVLSKREMHVQGLDVLELGAPAYSALNDPVHGDWPAVKRGDAAYRSDDATS